MNATLSKPCSRLKPLVVGQTLDGRYVYNVAKFGQLKLMYGFTTHGPSALKGEEALPEHIDVRRLPVEFQRHDLTNGQRVIEALNAGWEPSEEQQERIRARRYDQVNSAEADIRAAYRKHGQRVDWHDYWNTDEDFYIDIFQSCAPLSEDLRAALSAIEAKYQSGLVRIHIGY